MEIKQYTVSDLREGRYPNSVLPIERVSAQITNPRASENDVVLLVGYEGDKAIATLGVIPDYIFLHGKRSKIGWLNNWNASYDGHGGAAALLFLKAASLYQNNLGVSGFTEQARPVYENSRKFIALCEKKGASFYFRFSLNNVLPKRFPKLTPFVNLLVATDALLNQGVNIRLSRWISRRRRHHNYSTSVAHNIDEVDAQFVNLVRPRELFLRGFAELNWIIKSRWSEGDCREVVFVKVFSNSGTLIGLLMLSSRASMATLPYYFCRPSDLDVCLTALCQHLIERDVSELLVYDEEIVMGLNRLGFPVMHTRPRQKSFLISRLYQADDLTGFHVHDGDGDAFA